MAPATDLSTITTSPDCIETSTSSPFFTLEISTGILKRCPLLSVRKTSAELLKSAPPAAEIALSAVSPGVVLYAPGPCTQPPTVTSPAEGTMRTSPGRAGIPRYVCAPGSVVLMTIGWSFATAGSNRSACVRGSATPCLLGPTDPTLSVGVRATLDTESRAVVYGSVSDPCVVLGRLDSCSDPPLPAAVT